jgi:hypothetical protein
MLVDGQTPPRAPPLPPAAYLRLVSMSSDKSGPGHWVPAGWLKPPQTEVELTSAGAVTGSEPWPTWLLCVIAKLCNSSRRRNVDWKRRGKGYWAEIDWQR